MTRTLIRRVSRTPRPRGWLQRTRGQAIPWAVAVITAMDPNANDLVSYTLGGADASSFGIGLTRTGQIAVGTMLDYETKTSYMVKVIATDSFGATASIDVTITVTDVNEGPVIMRGMLGMLGGIAISGSMNEEYAENGTGVVATYTATGSNAAMATWSLSGDDAGAFIITGGDLAFEAEPDFESPADMDGDNVYQITVNADDGTYMDTHEVTVRVTDVDGGDRR